MSLRPVLSALGLPLSAAAAFAQARPVHNWQPHNWQTGLQTPATTVMERMALFHAELLWVVIAIGVLVAGLLMTVVFRFNRRANPVPSTTHHNATLETLWQLVPAIVLVGIAVPSFRLLAYEADGPKPDVTIEAIGHRWYWTYVYPKDGAFRFDSAMLQDAAAKEQGKPRQLGTDNPVVVPVNKTVEVIAAGADAIQSWSVPAFGVKMDAVPGRRNRAWFRATRLGTYYGLCPQSCGAIEVKVVSEAAYRAWRAEAQLKYATAALVSN